MEEIFQMQHPVESISAPAPKERNLRARHGSAGQGTMPDPTPAGRHRGNILA